MSLFARSSLPASSSKHFCSFHGSVDGARLVQRSATAQALQRQPQPQPQRRRQTAMCADAGIGSLGATAPVEPAVPAAAAASVDGVAACGGVEPAVPAATAAYELDDSFTGLACSEGFMTVAGFGSLLSETSARSTFPQLQNFRQGRLRGWRRVFAHQCDIFFARGIARPETREVSSLSVEEHPGSEIVVSLFEVEASPESVAAFIEREHEFRFVAVDPLHLDGSTSIGRRAVVCARWNDEAYRQRRCPPHEWQRRYGKHGVQSIWTDDVLPCRVYLRHCVLAAQRLGPEAYASFLDGTFLSDRATTVRQHLQQNPGILEELPPPSLVGRYSG